MQEGVIVDRRMLEIFHSGRTDVEFIPPFDSLFRSLGSTFKTPNQPCYMIVSFYDTGTEDVFNGKDSKAARKTCPGTVWGIAVRKLDQLDSVLSLNDLRIPPGNRLEALRGNRKGQYSIRINDQYRICFNWSSSGPERVEITDYH